MPGDSNYLSQHFRQTASLGLLEAKGTSRLAVEVQAIRAETARLARWKRRRLVLNIIRVQNQKRDQIIFVVMT